MKLVVVIALVTAFVFCDSFTLMQFTSEILQVASLHNYDAIFFDLEEIILTELIRNPKIPRWILQLCSAPLIRKRIIYFIEFSTHSANVSRLLSCYSQGIILLYYRNSSLASEFVINSTVLLRKLKISKAIHVIYDLATLSINLIPYDFIPARIQPVSFSCQILKLFNPNDPTDIQGYRYAVHHKQLYPYFYWVIDNGAPIPLGLDVQLLQAITSHQNATLQFQYEPKPSEPCPPVDPSVDLNIRRSACNAILTDRLYLPQWDETCVIVPKRHQSLALLQFTKPFHFEVWVLTAVYVVARFFCRFERWRLLLLIAILMEFWLTECYEVKVIQYMTTLRYAPNPKTMAELIARREKFIVGLPDRHYLEAYSNVDKEVVTSSKDKYLGQRALLYFCLTAEAYVHSDRNYNSQTNDRLNILLKERLVSYPSSYGFASRHPMRANFERHLRYVFESGVWRKIHDKFLRKEEQFQPLVAPGEYLIEFGDLKPLWLACGVGWAVAVGIFVLERFWKTMVMG